METRELSGELYSTLVKGGAANLRANAKIVNDLNVFPIPDGDTGENMTLTISGGVNAAQGMKDKSLSETSDTIANGMLLSARGNSGVILSQFFSGIAKGFTGTDNADVKTVGFAFKSGVRRAYEAVMKPTEGTMLTVMREATDYACDRITDDSTMESFFEDVLSEMNRSLQRTPELLSVLKEAGVIDSGGQGLVYIVDGMNKTLKGEEIADSAVSFGTKNVDTSKFTADSVMEYGYCTEFLLQLQKCKVDTDNFKIDPILEFLNTIGDSIVAFKTGTIVKVHVHTMTPGKVFEFCQQFGEFLTIKCENMTVQHNDTIKEEDTGNKEENSAPKKKFALVSVCDGAGIKDVQKALGADVVIDGGQGNNPSSETFINAFRSVNAETIFVLPNNSNIIMAALLAAEMYKDSDVRVIKSKSIGDGYAALQMLSYDSNDADTIEHELTDAMQGVVTGQVSRSVRDAFIDGIDIKCDNYIGFSGKNMLASAENKVDTATEMLEKLDAKHHEVLIAIYGNSASYDERKEFARAVKEKFPHTELYEIDGCQDVYDFELILE